VHTLAELRHAGLREECDSGRGSGELCRPAQPAAGSAVPLLPAASGTADPAQRWAAWGVSDKGRGAKVCRGLCAAPRPGAGLRQVSQWGHTQISIPVPLAPLVVPRCRRQRPARGAFLQQGLGEAQSLGKCTAGTGAAASISLVLWGWQGPSAIPGNPNTLLPHQPPLWGCLKVENIQLHVLSAAWRLRGKWGKSSRSV